MINKITKLTNIIYYQNVIVTDEYFYETQCLTLNLLLFIIFIINIYIYMNFERQTNGLIIYEPIDMRNFQTAFSVY